jgi:hypothetical protein
MIAAKTKRQRTARPGVKASAVEVGLADLDPKATSGRSRERSAGDVGESAEPVGAGGEEDVTDAGGKGVAGGRVC